MPPPGEFQAEDDETTCAAVAQPIARPHPPPPELRLSGGGVSAPPVCLDWRGVPHGEPHGFFSQAQRGARLEPAEAGPLLPGCREHKNQPSTHSMIGREHDGGVDASNGDLALPPNADFELLRHRSLLFPPGRQEETQEPHAIAGGLRSALKAHEARPWEPGKGGIKGGEKTSSSGERPYMDAEKKDHKAPALPHQPPPSTLSSRGVKMGGGAYSIHPGEGGASHQFVRPPLGQVPLREPLLAKLPSEAGPTVTSAAPGQATSRREAACAVA
jgi:hypothetical protein